MKKLLFVMLAAFAGQALAFDVYNGVNSAGKPQWSSSSVVINPLDGRPVLQQDMINNSNSNQNRTFGYVSHWQASSGTTTGTHFTQVSLRATAHDGVLLPGVFLIVDEVGTLNGGENINLPIPIRIPATADVKLSAISDAANANAVVMGAIMGWFEP